MYARTNAGSAHGDFQDRNGVNYSSTESFGHCSQLFWKKDPSESGVRKTVVPPPLASDHRRQTSAAGGRQRTTLRVNAEWSLFCYSWGCIRLVRRPLLGSFVPLQP